MRIQKPLTRCLPLILVVAATLATAPARLLAFGLRLPTWSTHAIGKPGALLEHVRALFARHFVLGLLILIGRVLVVVVVVLYDALSIRSVPAVTVSVRLPSA